MAHERVLVSALVIVTSVSGCWPTFPDELLRPPRDAARDVRTDAVSDLGALDVPDVGVLDAGLDAGLRDSGQSDSDMADGAMLGDGGDGGDGSVKPMGDNCDMAPTTEVPGMRTITGLTDASDFTFDNTGAVIVGIGNTVVRVRGMSREVLATSTQGIVAFVRYTRRGGLVVAVNSSPDAGGTSAGLYVIAPGETTLTARVSSLMHIGGLAVAPDDSVWFTDTVASRLYRVEVPGSDAPDVVQTAPPLMSPSLLAFDATGARLFVARNNVPSVYAVDLSPTDSGTAHPQVVCATGLLQVSGMTTDACGNVYVSDVITAGLGRIYRIAGTCDSVSTRFGEASAMQGLAFGPGGTFGQRELFTLQPSDGSLLGFAAVVRGAPNPVPVP